MSNLRLWPAEWEKHAATWIAWPSRQSIWQNYYHACYAYAEVANKISESEPVKMLINDNDEHLSLAKRLLSSDIELIKIGIDDSWVRDTMAIFVYANPNINDTLIATDWRFNAWGEKFKPYDCDQAQVKSLANLYHWNVETVDMVLEGGSIHSNGEGVLLTTQECLLNPNRNPNKSKVDIEQTLKKHLNVNQILWLPFGINNDIDTDGHIDNVACFVNNKTILIQSCYNHSDPNYLRHQKNLAYLKSYQHFDVIELEQPETFIYNNQPLALSYLNFYITNDSIIMPRFKQKHFDTNARSIIASCFPKHKVVTIDNALTIAKGGGGIHCITMQQPQGVIQCV